MSCAPGCYEIKIEACDNFTLKTALPPNASYSVFINKAGSERFFKNIISTDTSGFLTINKSLFPPGFFSIGNFYQVKLRVGVDINSPVQPLIFNSIPYDCMLLEVVNVLEAV